MEIQEKINFYKIMNEITLKNEIVIFGASLTANLPLYELINKIKLEQAIYNRSFEELTTENALKLLQTCVIDVKPKKVFLYFDEKTENTVSYCGNINRIIDKILFSLPETEVYLLSVTKTSTLKDKRVHNVILPYFETPDLTYYKRFFKILTPLFRRKTIDFCDVFNMEF